MAAFQFTDCYGNPRTISIGPGLIHYDCGCDGSFVLPGGHQIVSYCHIARCVCRRAERLSVHLSEVEHVPEIVVKYLNRLSDYLFVLSRKLSQDNQANEIPWKARM